MQELQFNNNFSSEEQRIFISYVIADRSAHFHNIKTRKKFFFFSLLLQGNY